MCWYCGWGFGNSNLVRMPPLHTIHVPSYLLLVLDARNETKEEGVTRIGQALSDLFGETKKIQQTVSAVFAFWILQTVSEELLTLWISGRTSWKIRFYIEKAIFLFTFFNKSLEVSRLFLIFATDSVSPFVWVSGLFTGKGRLRNVNLQISNLANLTIIGRDMATRTSTKGVLYPVVSEHIVV